MPGDKRNLRTLFYPILLYMDEEEYHHRQTDRDNHRHTDRDNHPNSGKRWKKSRTNCWPGHRWRHTVNICRMAGMEENKSQQLSG